MLACTPTLEVGVSLDGLHAVILRNLPPAPANYAQQVGRAGRRSRVALAVAHPGQGPHDSYFFESSGELIAGQVRALAGEQDDPGLDPDLPGMAVIARDDHRRDLELAVDPVAWARSETERAASLASANHLRLAGWRLRRVISRPNGRVA